MSPLRIRRRLFATWCRFVRRFDPPLAPDQVSPATIARAASRVAAEERRIAGWPVQQINSGWEYQQRVAARIRQ